ncbi:MAG: hypothetical protein ACXADH_15400 [Candidatus Kariarchaeaceae archaeon]|jgi:hypothetical protein
MQIHEQIVILFGYPDEQLITRKIRDNKLLAWGNGLIKYDNPEIPALIVTLNGTTLSREQEFFQDLVDESMLDGFIFADSNRNLAFIHYDGSEDHLGVLRNSDKNEAQEGNYIWAKALESYFVW